MDIEKIKENIELVIKKLKYMNEKDAVLQEKIIFMGIDDLIGILTFRQKEKLKEISEKIDSMITDQGTEFSLGYDQAIVEIRALKLLNK